MNTARIKISHSTDYLDILINNAGINGIEFNGNTPVLHFAITTSVDKFKEVCEVYIFGAIRITQAFLTYWSDLLNLTLQMQVQAKVH